MSNKKITKKNYILQELLLVGNRHDTGEEGGRRSHVLEVCEVRSWLPKTNNNDEAHKNDADTLSFDIWSMLLLTSASYKLLKSLLQDSQRSASSNIVLKENNLPPIIYCLFS